MVATHSQLRRPSDGSMGHSSGRSRRRSSLRRQNEKLSSSILPPTAATHSTSTTARGVNSHSGRRSRSVSAGSHHHSQQLNNRRPSAPAVVEIPRLSIADRFMSSNFNCSAPPPLPQQPSRSTTPSTTSNSLVNSASYNMPTTGSSNSRLSVADRFMNNASPTNSTLSLSGIQQYRERSASSFSGRATPNTRSSSITAPTTISSDPVPGRLTIANAFMKSSSTFTPSIDTRSRAPSFRDLDLGVANGNNKDRYSKTSPVNTQQIHPLEEQQRSIFDDNNTSYLNLDLSISPPSASSSVLNNRSNSRPWGSQDTLVHHYQSERKKPIYAQFMESEKNATIMTSDNRSFSLGDYFLDNNSPDNHHHHHDKHMMNDDLSTKHGYDDYDDIEIGGGYDKHYAHERQWSYEEEEDEDEKSYQENKSSPAVSTTKLKKQHDIEQAIGDYDNNNTRGFWVGCCFVSCGSRPSRQTMEQCQKQRREKDTEGDVRHKNRGFGKKGWVFCIFLSILVSILIGVFLWPRTPLMRIEGASLTSPAKITETKQGVMVGNVAFESEWMVNITVDNRQNHVPTRLVQVQVLAKDALTGLVIGKGLHNDDPNPEHIILAPNAISTIQIPIHVDYQARDSTDTTFVDLTKACSPQQVPFNSPNGNNQQSNGREALPLHFWITLHFFGLDWTGYKPTVIATPSTGGFACPQS